MSKPRWITQPYILAIFSIMGIVVGGFLNHYFSLRESEISKLQNLKVTLYSDFINGAVARNSSSDGSEQNIHGENLRNSAKFQICLYANKDVVEAMAEYAVLREKLPDPLNKNPKFRKATINLFRQMRKDAFPKSQWVNDSVLSNILFPSVQSEIP